MAPKWAEKGIKLRKKGGKGCNWDAIEFSRQMPKSIELCDQWARQHEPPALRRVGRYSSNVGVPGEYKLYKQCRTFACGKKNCGKKKVTLGQKSINEEGALVHIDERYSFQLEECTSQLSIGLRMGASL